MLDYFLAKSNDFSVGGPMEATKPVTLDGLTLQLQQDSKNSLLPNNYAKLSFWLWLHS